MFLKYNFYKILTILLTLNIVCYAQIIEDKILVRIGENYLTKSEFEDRLNFTPKVGIEDKNNSDGVKRELLYTLIAEKLWSNFAKEEGYENNPSVITARNVMLKMFVRDELYQREIKGKIEYIEDEVKEAEKKYNKIISANVYFSQERDIIFELYSLLSQNKIAEDSSQNAPNNQINKKDLIISYGDLDIDIENVIYSLNVNQTSTPIQMEGIWNIFHVAKTENRQYANLNERNNAVKEIIKILKSRKEETNYAKFHKEFFADKKVDADGNLFKQIAQKMSTVFSEKDNAGIYVFDKKNKKVIYFDSEDLRDIEVILGNEILDQPFIKFSQNPITVRTFLREISFLSFNVSNPDYEAVKLKLNEQLKDYIKYELLAREGLKKGLDNTPNVTKWLKIWNENFLYQVATNDFLKRSTDQYFSVNDPENFDKYAQNVKNEIKNEKFDLFVEKTIELSNRYNIEINKEMFDSINQGNINLFVMRNLGFGGTITAVPASPSFIEWFLEKEKRNSKNL